MTGTIRAVTDGQATWWTQPLYHQALSWPLYFQYVWKAPGPDACGRSSRSAPHSTSPATNSSKGPAMSAHLIIEDGAAPYWWASTDIWVVPGNDPAGTPGSPVAGQPSYLWARVSNAGDSAVRGARVDFYWANPSAQIAIGVASQVGSAYVDLDAGETQDVLCLVPWVPVMVNGGHECLIATVHGTYDLDPIPDPLPNGYLLDPPAHDQIAQLNISVLIAAQLRVSLAVMVNGGARADKDVVVTVERGGPLPAALLERLSLRRLRPASRPRVSARLSRQPRCADGRGGDPELMVKAARGTFTPVYVSIQAEDLPAEEYEVVHVVERAGDHVLGGVSYLITNPKSDGKEYES
jgi:hypothetical protein